MKHLLAATFVVFALFGLTAGKVLAHHNTQHSQGPCGIKPCSDRK
jgi:hypothetical protein